MEMDKKLFEELKEGLQQMADHAAGKKVEGVREVTYNVPDHSDHAILSLDEGKAKELASALERPARNIRALRNLLTEPGVFDPE